MSEENVATVRAIFEAINRGDLDEAVEHVPEDFVADWSASAAPESGVFRGRGDVRRIFEQTSESWSEMDYFESEIIEFDDLVVRVGGLRARGKGSGAEVTAHGTQVWSFDGATPVSVRLYQSKAEALEAVGLPEQVSNGDLVRRLIAAWNDGDRTAIVGHLHPEAEIRTIRSELEARPYRGPEGARRALADFDQEWEYVRFTDGELRGEGDRVVLLTNLQARGRASGIELDVPLGILWSFEGDRIIELRSFSDPAEALRAAGIEA